MQCVLDLISKLGKNSVRNILRILCNKVNANALRTDQLHYLFDLFKQGTVRSIKQHMSLIEEKDHLRLWKISCFR